MHQLNDLYPDITRLTSSPPSPSNRSEWKDFPETAGVSAARALLARFADRSELANEFINQPFGQHSPELRFIVDVMRSQPLFGNWFTVMTKQYSEWRALCWSLDRPLRVELMAPDIFNSREDVERWVFKRRWLQLIGSLKEETKNDL